MRRCPCPSPASPNATPLHTLPLPNHPPSHSALPHCPQCSPPLPPLACRSRFTALEVRERRAQADSVEAEAGVELLRQREEALADSEAELRARGEALVQLVDGNGRSLELLLQEQVGAEGRGGRVKVGLTGAG